MVIFCNLHVALLKSPLTGVNNQRLIVNIPLHHKILLFFFAPAASENSPDGLFHPRLAVPSLASAAKLDATVPTATFSPPPDGTVLLDEAFSRGILSRRFPPPRQPTIGVFLQTRLVLDTAARRVNSVPLWVYSILSPFRSSLCTRELKISDLCGFIFQCELFPPSCPLLSLYSRCPSAFQGLCVFWRSENNKRRSLRPQISIYHQKLPTRVQQEMSR